MNSTSEVISRRRALLGDFFKQYGETVSSDELEEYLKHWQVETEKELLDVLALDEVKKLENVWLSRRFEMPEREQLMDLVTKFEDCLDEWESREPLSTPSAEEVGRSFENKKAVVAFLVMLLGAMLFFWR